MRFVAVVMLVAVVAMVGCKAPCTNTLPPAPMLAAPGPGVDGPGPGVMCPAMPMAPMCVGLASQVAFVGPEGMAVQWDVSSAGMFDSSPIIAPGRYDFPQAAVYRLKLTNIPGRPGVELYPTLEVGAAMPRTAAFLAHNAIPFQLTEEDFDQVLSGNFVTKVIYLPDPEFQEMALAGVETLVSTRLDPGVDPIVEADRRGAILAIIRVGNKDLEVPGGQMISGANGGGMSGVMPTAAMLPVGGACPPNFVAGVTAPQYGMPMVGTPIGLPGPPHVPLGVPAGLKKHVMVNHTQVQLPEPTRQVRIDVRQEPGYSYPEPANHVSIVERADAGHACFHDKYSHQRAVVAPEAPVMACPTPCP